ncbi:MAG: adenylate/guanylate cyclase domain-containing protein, partial [Chloroflexaceae bacterium]|nr:adenylate/guanylate cyclase domain-containing protein [Chloroflexaceae bacterium]
MTIQAPALLETFASYVPGLIIHYLTADPRPLTGPVAERFPAAVLLADISGFTALTEELTRSGPAGVEEVSSLLNRYFGILIDLIDDHGGDIVEFTGDGVIALWPTVISGETLAEATVRAVQCGLLVQQQIAAFTTVDNLHLTLRISIGAGEVLFATVGGALGRWELVVAGEPLTQASAAEHYTTPGDVVLSPEALALAHAYLDSTSLSDGFARVTAVPAPLLPPVRAVPAITLTMLPAIRGYIPGAVLERLMADQAEWLAELRYVTVIFLCIDGLNYLAHDALEQVQLVMHTLQAALYHYEGSVNQFIVDDKGTVLVAAFGLPPLTHQHDAMLAVQAATAMHARLQQLGSASSSGIATGWVFCGARGNTRRRDYAMIGDVMNLAARLMQASVQMPHGDLPPVICDTTTYIGARSHLAFEQLPPIKVKGKSEPVAIYRPMGRVLTTTRTRTPIIGRNRERTLLREQLDMLIAERIGGVVIIEGEVGMGKSRLISDVLEQAHELHVITLAGTGDAIEHNTSYHAWRPIFIA